MRVFYCFVFILYILLPSNIYAQIISTDDRADELFLYEVKSIDEFMERFNDDRVAHLRREYAKQNKPFTLSRKQLILSLLNRENQSLITDTTLRDFIFTSTDSTKPQFLFFNDSNWYAEANCLFTYKNKKIKIPVILHIHSEPNKGANWMIAGIGKSKVIKDTGKVSLSYKTTFVPNSKYISTPSNEINFVELANVFTPVMNANYYFENSILNQSHTQHFIKLVLESKIFFNYVTDIKYHFYQIPNRILDVEYFNRNTKNSGWLINKIEKATDTEKESSLKKLLNL